MRPCFVTVQISVQEAEILPAGSQPYLKTYTLHWAHMGDLWVHHSWVTGTVLVEDASPPKIWGCSSFLALSYVMEKTFRITRSNQQPDVPSPTTLTHVPIQGWGLHHPFQCLATLPMKKFFLLSNPNLPWHNPQEGCLLITPEKGSNDETRQPAWNCWWKKLRKLELLKKKICHEKWYLKRCHLVDSHGVWQLKAGYAWLAGVRTHAKAWQKRGSLPPACPSWSFRPLPDAKQTNDAKLAVVLPPCFIYFIFQNQQLGNKCPLKAELSTGWVIFLHPYQHLLCPHSSYPWSHQQLHPWALQVPPSAVSAIICIWELHLKGEMMFWELFSVRFNSFLISWW